VQRWNKFNKYLNHIDGLMAKLIALFAILIMLGGASATKQSVCMSLPHKMTNLEALDNISNGHPIKEAFIEGDLDLYKLGRKSLDAIAIQGCCIGGKFNMSDLHLKANADFSNTTFNGDANFKGDRFDDSVIFNDAKFRGYVNFTDSTSTNGIGCSNSTFCLNARFENITSSGYVNFFGAKFLGPSEFYDATFSGLAVFHFERAFFGGKSTFQNILVENSMYFSDASVSGDIEFWNLTIGFADFRSTCFYGKVNFEDSSLGETLFRNCTFKNNIEFNKIIFNKYADFLGADFRGDVSFSVAEAAEFNGGTSFQETHFWGRSFFDAIKFKGGKLNFFRAHFANDTCFDSAEFDGDANFKEAQFEGNSSFYSANLKGDTSFRGAKFGNAMSKTIANFTLAEFDGDTVMTDIYFINSSSYISFNDAKISRLDIEWDPIKDHLEYDGSTYLALIKNFRELEQFEDADNCYYEYRSNKQRDSIDLIILDFISHWSCGYGVSLTHTIGLSIGMMLIFAIWFWLFESSLEDAALFSVIIFLQAPRSERYSSMMNRHTYAVILEQILGWSLMAVFIVVLTRKLILS